jgi:superfamily I DNA/RNA helicase
VDEAQDFSLEALRLIHGISYAAESKDDPEKYPDPLCLAGDGHQRIYRVKVPMSRAGIDIRGRSRRLKINYRTTEQIRQFAQGILHGIEVDDLDDNVAVTKGDHSVISGAKPQVVPCESPEQETKAVVDWVQSLLVAGFATHEICVTPLSQAVQTALASKGIQTHVLQPRQVDLGSQEPGIRLATMQRIKGLEYRAVAMLCSDPKDPLNDLQAADTRAKCTRYVAATRAREQLFVSIARDRKANHDE